MHLIHDSPCGGRKKGKKKKKKRVWQRNISDLAPYYTACFHFMPVQLFFHMYDFQTKFNLIFPEIVSWDVPKFGGDLPRVYARIIYFIFFFFCFPSVIAMVCFL